MKIYHQFQEVFHIRILDLGKYRETLELTLFSTLSFLIPVLIGHPQILVGIIINALIVRTSLTMKGWKNIPAIVLPSLGALTRGALFGPLTQSLFYLIPFIWLGNLVISYLSKTFINKNLLYRILVPSLLKTISIFIPTLIFIKISAVPSALISQMSIIQLITAVIGSSFAIIVTRFEKARSS